MPSLILTAVAGVCGLAATEPMSWTTPDATTYAARTDMVAVLAPTDPALGEPMGFGDWRLVGTGGRPLAAVLAGLAGRAGFATPVLVGLDGGPVVPTRDLLVVTEDEDRHPALAARVESEARRLGINAAVEAPWAGLPVQRVRTDAARGDDVLTLAKRLADLPGVRLAEPDMMFTGRSSLIPNDPLFSQVWGIRNTGQSGGLPDADMDGDEAWDLTTGDPSIITVVIDTGVQQNHPDINQLAGFDPTDNETAGGPGNDCDNHGTPVAGCVSARINNNLGTVGIAPGTRTASVRAFVSSGACDGSWTSFSSWTVGALDFATGIGARVTNNSNAYGFTSGAIEAAYASTRNAGIVHFGSAGNNSANFSTYPASLPTVNSIGAINRFGDRASFSNFGPTIFATAPGDGIVTTDRTGSNGWTTGDYVSAWGTSFASPYAAGIAALVLSVDPSLAAAEVESILASTADDYGTTGRDDIYGWGVLNARAAVEAAMTGGDCPADLAPPMGVLDLADVVAFVTAFSAGDPAADLAPPAGLLDLSDVVAFATAFTAGCP